MWVWVFIGIAVVYDLLTKHRLLAVDIVLIGFVSLFLYLLGKPIGYVLRKVTSPARAGERARKKAVKEAQTQQECLAKEWELAPPLPTQRQISDAIYNRAIHSDGWSEEITLVANFAVGFYDLTLDKTLMRPAEALAACQHYVEAAVDVVNTYQKLRPAPVWQPGCFWYEHVYTEEEQIAVARELRSTFQNYYQRWKEARPDIPDPLNKDDYRNKDGDVNWTKYEAAETRRQKEIDQVWDDVPPLQQALADTPLYWRAQGALPDSQHRPLPLKPSRRYEGTWIIAPPGRGKTNLLWQLVDRDLQTDEKTIVLVDSKGALIREFMHYPGAVILHKDNIRVNPFSFGTDVLAVEFAEYLLSSLVGLEMTQLQRTMFSSVIEVLMHIPHATLQTFHDILSDGIDQYQAAVKQCNPITKAFFLKGKTPDWKNEQSQRTKGEVRARLRTLLRYDYMRNIFLAPSNSHYFLDLLNSRRLIIIDNSKDDLGEQGAEFLGRFFIALIRMEGVRRTKLARSQKVPLYLYIDEAQNVISTDRKLRSIIQECRDQNIALTVAHQYIDDISAEVRPALYNCAIRIANADEEAPEIAPRLNASVEEVKLPAHTFCVYVRDETPKPVRIKVDFLDLARIPKGEPYVPPSPPAPEEAEVYAYEEAAPVDDPPEEPAPEKPKRNKGR